MPVAIRLSRIGTKHKPFYRVVVVDSRKKRDGAELENIGTYDAVKGSLVRFDADRYEFWVKQGAQPTDTAKKLFVRFKKNNAEAAKSGLSQAKNAEVKEAEAKMAA